MNRTNSILHLPYDIDNCILKMLKRGHILFHTYKGEGIYLARKDTYPYQYLPEDVEDEFEIDDIKIVVFNSF